MRRIYGYPSFLRVANKARNAFEVGRHRGEVALAFGRETPDNAGEYWDVDLIALAMTDRLMEFFENRKDAALLVRNFWPQWFVTLARAEDGQAHDFIFFVGGRKATPDLVKNWRVYGGHFKEVTSKLFSMPPDKRPTHFFYVDLWQTAQAVRAAAKREGVELDERFTYSLDDPRLEATIHEELRKHNARINRERKAGKPRAEKATPLVAAQVRTLIVDARRGESAMIL